MEHLIETDEGASSSVSAFFPAGSTVGPFGERRRHKQYFDFIFKCGNLWTDTSCFSPGSRLKHQARLYSSPIKNVYDPLICQVENYKKYFFKRK